MCDEADCEEYTGEPLVAEKVRAVSRPDIDLQEIDAAFDTEVMDAGRKAIEDWLVEGREEEGGHLNEEEQEWMLQGLEQAGNAFLEKSHSEVFSRVMQGEMNTVQWKERICEVLSSWVKAYQYPEETDEWVHWYNGGVNFVVRNIVPFVDRLKL